MATNRVQRPAASLVGEEDRRPHQGAGGEGAGQGDAPAEAGGHRGDLLQGLVEKIGVPLDSYIRRGALDQQGLDQFHPPSLQAQLALDVLEHEAAILEVGEIQGQAPPQGPQIQHPQHSAHAGVDLQQAALADGQVDFPFQGGGVEIARPAGPGETGLDLGGGLRQGTGIAEMLEQVAEIPRPGRQIENRPRPVRLRRPDDPFTLPLEIELTRLDEPELADPQTVGLGCGTEAEPAEFGVQPAQPLDGQVQAPGPARIGRPRPRVLAVAPRLAPGHRWRFSEEGPQVEAREIRPQGQRLATGL